MRILILCHSFNSLTQRLHVELRERGHHVSVEFDINDAVTREAVDLFRPDILLAPFLKRAIPEDVWRALPCLVVHPGPRGDRGPSALDWALLEGEEQWGVTIICANGEMDGGRVLAWREFPMREATKSSLYRKEATEAAVAAVLEALTSIEGGSVVGDGGDAPPGRARPYCNSQARRVDFACDDVKSALAKIRSADGEPGAAAKLFGREMRVFDAHPANLSGAPGEIVARSGPALGIALGDGAIWIGHVRAPEPRSVKLPAALYFAAECESLLERGGYPGVRYEQRGMVGLLEFPFYNGAMGTQACADLKAAVAAAAKRATSVLVLTGGPDYWSNGLDLARIEASRSPAEESWANINAMNDLVREILLVGDKCVVSAMRGNAGAGGVFLALAADEVWMRESVVLNPHYKDMGNLYGSEYWTYLLPRRVDKENRERLARTRLPVGIREALRLALVDSGLQSHNGVMDREILARATALAAAPDLSARIAKKQEQRARDEAERPLEYYREAELAKMRRNFWGFDPSYHVARHNFIRKVPKSRTPAALALHRAFRSASAQQEMAGARP
jgi:putative two-component system hydrogenase maturation factor HypX/HoxX